MIPAKRTWVRAVLCACAIARCWSPFLPEAHSAGLRRAAPPAPSASGISSNAPVLRQVAAGIYMYKDTCNVYAIVNGPRAILIDFGSGGILSELPSLGVQKVDWILHTHFHRDQAQGDQLARARGIEIAVPATERKYFDHAETFWNEKDRAESLFTPATLNAAYPTWMPGSKEILFSASGSLWRQIVVRGKPGENQPERLPFVGEDGLMPVLSRPQPWRPSR